MIFKAPLVTTILIMFGASLSARAEPPQILNILDFELGITPTVAEQKLKERFPTCRIVKKYFHDTNMQPTAYISEMSNDSLSECRKTVNDEVTLTFVHPDVSSDQPAERILISRFYAPKDNPAKYTLDAVTKPILEKYGQPSNTLLPAKSALEQKGTIKGIDAYEQHRSKQARFIWAKEAVDVDSYCHDDRCGRYILQAQFNIALNRANPKDKNLYVRSLTMILSDDFLQDKSISWLYAQKEALENKELSF